MRRKESDISNVHLNPAALTKSFSSSAFAFCPFLLDFVSNSFVLYKDVWRRFVNATIAKTAKLHCIKIFFLLTPSLLFPVLSVLVIFLSLYNLENPQVNGESTANAVRVRLTNSSQAASSSK